MWTDECFLLKIKTMTAISLFFQVAAPRDENYEITLTLNDFHADPEHDGASVGVEFGKGGIFAP